jgi:hypothetical protein
MVAVVLRTTAVIARSASEPLRETMQTRFAISATLNHCENGLSARGALEGAGF